MQNKITSDSAASDTEEMQFRETQYHNAFSCAFLNWSAKYAKQKVLPLCYFLRLSSGITRRRVFLHKQKEQGRKTEMRSGKVAYLRGLRI
jgi:hypothetical protein